MPNLDFSLTSKVAIVTGGKKGIGKAIALGFAGAGADVVICGRTADSQSQEVVKEITEFGRRALMVEADITRRVDIEKLLARTIEEFRRIDILVNNAGVLVKSPLIELPEADWDKVLDTDLKGYFLCSQIIGREMVKQNSGNIINIASGIGTRATPEMGVYGIAKAGVLMMTRVFAVELARYHIRVNAISPALVRTEMTSSQWSTEEALKRSLTGRPMGRIAEPEEMVGAAIYLASDASSYVTGANIMVDGGRYA